MPMKLQITRADLRPPSSKRVDAQSGQVYTQLASAPKTTHANGPSWVHESPFLPIGWEDCSARGAASLKHVAMRTVLADQRVLTAELFETVPWRTAQYLWECLGRSGKQTLYMWKVFATAYPDDFPARNPHRTMKIEGPLLPMPQYLAMVRSDAQRWRTVLTLAASFARVPDMVGVAGIRNLVALEVATPATPAKVPEGAETPMTAVSDRIVRTWGELAQTEGAFARVRVVRFTNQAEVTGAVLRYLKDFPALQVVIACGCPGLTPRPEVMDGWVLAEMDEPQAALYACYMETVRGDGGGSSSEGTQGPVLDFQIGRKCRRNNIEILVFRRVQSDRAEWAPKKLKRESTEGDKKPVKKAVMKNRPAQDLGALLGTFL